MRMRIKSGWDCAGRVGKVLGPNIYIGQAWTPIQWEGSDEPDWHKTAGLEQVGPRQEKYFYLDGKTVFEREIPEYKRDFPTFVRRDGRYFQFERADTFEAVYREIEFERA
jgi:hypothetical protein